MKPIIIATALAALLMGATACSDNDDSSNFKSPAEEAGQGSLDVAKATVTTLTFSWEAVDGVDQYGYTLTSPTSSLKRMGVTRQTSVSFENLEPVTVYELQVEAFGHNGMPTKVFRLTASTPDYVALATPDPSKMTAEYADGVMTLTWEAVEGAGFYNYSVVSSTGRVVDTGITEATILTIEGLEIGDYTLEVTARPGDEEGYLVSETGKFEFVRERQLTNAFVGTYTSINGNKTERTINLYEDGHYVIAAFYGVEGYDLECTISGTKAAVVNAVAADGTNLSVATGLDDDPMLIIDSSDMKMTPLPTGKTLKMKATLPNSGVTGYDTFVWKEK